MMKTNRISALLLTAMLASLCACGDTAAATDTTAPDTTDAETTEAAYPLPDANFGGEAFTILNGNTTDWMTIAAVTATEENGDVVNDAIYRRNLNVEERYNVKIVEIPSSSVRSDVTKAISSNDTSFDIALMVSKEAYNIALDGGAVEFSTIPHVDVTNEWWVRDSVECFSIGNHVYFGINKFDTTHYDGVRVFFVNNAMVKKYNLESPYQLVFDGKWTLDSFLEMGMAVAQDLNGDSAWNLGDQFGYTSTNNIGGQTLMTSIGVFPSLGKDENDMLKLTMNSEKNIDKLITLTKLLTENDGLINPVNSSDSTGGVSDFMDGRVLFSNQTLSNVGNLRDMEDDFGILPGPKYDEAQKDYYSLGGNPYFMLVPVTSPDLEKTGLMMEALAYESVGIVDGAFYDTYLSTKVTRDEESSAMLDIIFGSLTYYHPVARDYVCVNITNRLWKGQTDFASYFASNEATIAGLIKEATAAYNANVK